MIIKLICLCLLVVMGIARLYLREKQRQKQEWWRELRFLNREHVDSEDETHLTS